MFAKTYSAIKVNYFQCPLTLMSGSQFKMRSILDAESIPLTVMRMAVGRVANCLHILESYLMSGIAYDFQVIMGSLCIIIYICAPFIPAHASLIHLHSSDWHKLDCTTIPR